MSQVVMPGMQQCDISLWVPTNANTELVERCCQAIESICIIHIFFFDTPLEASTLQNLSGLFSVYLPVEAQHHMSPYTI